MNIEEFREYCIAKKGVTESFPFDDKALVFKVMQKMFALTGLESNPATANLKCDPDRAIELRDEYDSILPGYHMSKMHWNTIEIENVPPKLLTELIDHSYNLVVQGLTKKSQNELDNL